MMRAGRHRACRPCIEYRSKRRRDRIRRACVARGVIDETLKQVKPSTLEMLRDADPDMHKAISHIAKAVRSKPMDPPYTHLRIILGGNSEDHLSILRDSFPTGSLRRRGW